MNLHAVRMKFTWTSYRRTNEVNMLCPCNTNEVDMRLINSSHEIHLKFIWISNDLNFTWTICELHKNYMTSTQEVPLYYTRIWFLASLLCTSYEWVCRSIVRLVPVTPLGRPRSEYTSNVECPFLRPNGQMTLKVKVNDLHFEYHLSECQDAYLMQIWWF